MGMRHAGRARTRLAPLAVVLASACLSLATVPLAAEPELVRSCDGLVGRLQAVAGTDCFELENLGEPDQSLYLLRRSPARATRRVLVAGGIHGNEPAGTEWAIRLAECIAAGTLSVPVHTALDIIPLINTWGWERNLRQDRLGLDINRDFVAFRTAEARAVRGLLEASRYDLVVDLHEDIRATGFYLYEYAPATREPARAVLEQVRALGVSLEQDARFSILRSRDGLIHAPLWGLWYMRANGKLSLANYARLRGTRAVYTLETPRRLDLDTRLDLYSVAWETLLGKVIR